MLSEISQAEKDNYHVVSLICEHKEQQGDRQEKEGENEGEVNRGGNEPRETMDSGKQTEGFRRKVGGGWASPVMGIKEGTYCMEHWVLYANNESWNATSKTNDVLYGH